MPRVLIVGATRGLGASLAKQYAKQPGTTVYTTTRQERSPAGHGNTPKGAEWIPGVDLMKSNVGDVIADQLAGGSPLEAVIITAGHFSTEDLDDKGPNWEEEVRMYTTSSIAPVFIVQRLHRAGLLAEGSKVVLVSSESGSVGLRHEKEGGGNYAHHASKTALNMIGKLLSLDLKGKGVVVSVVHPGFMRTEMTKGVGFDQFWEEGGAVSPDEAAKTLLEWTAKLDLTKTGQYWAPRGPNDIGTASAVLGDNLPTPLQLPW